MASTTIGRLNVFLNADISGLNRGLKQASRRFTRFGRQMEGIGRSFTQNVTVPILAGGAAIVKASADWETAMVNVAKTVDATDAEITSLGRSFRALSEQIPVSANQLAAIGAEAGQLGIATRNILGFTRTVAGLQVASDLGQEAGSSLARLANITGTSQTEFDRLGSTIVDLGNKSASTESEIVDMGLRIAGAGRQIGLTAAETLGFASALSSLGIRSEAGGTAISRVFSDIATAVAKGGSKLNRFAEIAGLSADEFRERFAEDGADAVITFIEGLRRLGDQGVNLFGVLDEVGFGGIRVRDMLLRASSASDILRDSLETGTAAWKENSALAAEAEKFYNRLSGRLKILWNRVVNTAAAIGDALRPAIDRLVGIGHSLLNVVNGLVQKFANLSPALREQVGLFIALGATFGPILVGLGIAIALFGKAVAVMAAVMSGLGVVGLGIIAIKNNWLGMGEAAARVWDTVLSAASTAITAILNFVKPPINFIVGLFVGLAEVAAINWDIIRFEFVQAFKKIRDFARPILSGLAWAMEKLGSIAAGVAQGIRDMLTDGAAAGEEGGSNIGERSAAAFAEAFGRDYVGSFVGIIKTGIQRARDVIARVIERLRSMAGSGQLATELEEVDTELKDINKGLEGAGTDGPSHMSKLADAVQNVAGSFADTMADAITGATVRFKDFVKAAIADLARLAARFAIFKTLTSLFNLTSGGFFGSSLLGFMLPKPDGKASGGPVVGGTPYIVGERGPELFVPGSAGTIVPNDAVQTGGSGVSFDFSTFPAPSNPLAMARDAQWMRFLTESLENAKAGGYSFQGAG